MKVKDVLAELESVLPSSLIEEGDNCGLLVGDYEKEVTHIRTALEASEEVINQSIADGVDLLVVHHPMIYSPLKNVTTKTLRGGKVIKLIESGISLYAAHSNLDRAEGGLNQRFGRQIGMDSFEAIDDDGYILVGELEADMPLRAFVNMLCQRLATTSLNYVGEDHRMIKRVAFCTGSGVGLLEDRVFDYADVFLTGDLKYHDAMDIYEKGQAIVDVTHFGSELMAGEVLYDLVTQVIQSVKVTCDSSMTNPIKQ